MAEESALDMAVKEANQKLSAVLQNLKESKGSFDEAAIEMEADLELMKRPGISMEEVKSILRRALKRVKDLATILGESIQEREKEVSSVKNTLTALRDELKEVSKRLDNVETNFTDMDLRKLIGETTHEAARKCMQHTFPRMKQRQPLTFSTMEGMKKDDDEEEHFEEFMSLFEKATGISRRDLYTLDLSLRDLRFTAAHLNPAQKQQADVAVLKSKLGDVLKEKDEIEDAKKYLDFLASFSTEKKLFSSNRTVYQRIQMMKEEEAKKKAEADANAEAAAAALKVAAASKAKKGKAKNGMGMGGQSTGRFGSSSSMKSSSLGTGGNDPQQNNKFWPLNSDDAAEGSVHSGGSEKRKGPGSQQSSASAFREEEATDTGGISKKARRTRGNSNRTAPGKQKPQPMTPPTPIWLGKFLGRGHV